MNVLNSLCAFYYLSCCHCFTPFLDLRGNICYNANAAPLVQLTVGRGTPRANGCYRCGAFFICSFGYRRGSTVWYTLLCWVVVPTFLKYRYLAVLSIASQRIFRAPLDILPAPHIVFASHSRAEFVLLSLLLTFPPFCVIIKVIRGETSFHGRLACWVWVYPMKPSPARVAVLLFYSNRHGYLSDV